MYVVNLEEYSDIRTHWMALHANKKAVAYFDSFQKKFINNKNIIANIFRIQAYDSVRCGNFVLVLSIICLRVKA